MKRRHPGGDLITHVRHEDQAMPCPRCGTMHRAGPYIERPDLKKDPADGVPYAPADVTCECGAVLRHAVPVFAVGPYGWHWIVL